MGIKSVGEIWEGRRGSMDESRVRRYTRVFRVLTDDWRDGIILVGSAPGLPLFGAPYNPPGDTADPGARVTGIDPEQQQADPHEWRVTIQYSSAGSKTGDQGSGAGAAGKGNDPSTIPENPLLRPPEISWDFATYKKVLRRADRVNFGPIVAGVQQTTLTLNVPVLNSAGFPFDPPHEEDDHRIVLRYVRNELAYHPVIALGYLGHANSDVFLGCAAGIARCQKYTGSWAFENGIQFYKVSYEFEFREEGWDVDLLDCGFQGRGYGGKPHVFLDAFGHPRSEPTLLDGSGHELPSYAVPVYLTYRPKVRVPFANLGIVLPPGA